MLAKHKMAKEKLNVVQRVIGIIVSPRSTIQYLNQHPDHRTPLLLISASGLIVTLVEFPQLWEELLEIAPTPPPFSPSIGMGIGMAVSPIAAVSHWLETALLIFLPAIILFQASVSFKKLLSVTGYALIPNFFKSVIRVTTVLITGRTHFSPGLTGLLPEQGNEVLYTLLANLDIFQIWTFFLLILVVRTTCNLSKRWAVLILLFPWIMNIVFAVVLS